jgi:HK97 family phage portal protein
MGLRDAWKALINNNQQTKNYGQGNVVSYYQTGYNNATNRNSYEDLARDGYIENPIVYKCVNEISNGVAAVPFKLMRGDQPIDDHPLLDLLQRPNPTHSGSEYFQKVVSYLLLSGNTYQLRVGSDSQPPNELFTLRPDRIRIKTDKHRFMPIAYEYCIDGQVKAVYPIDQITGQSEVKQTKLFNPVDDYMGQSPIMPSASDIDQHNLSAKHNTHLLINGARPSGAVVYKPRDEVGAMTMLTDSQREQLRADLQQRFTGTNGAGKTMILEGDFDYKEMGLSPKDMDFATMRNMSAQDIALVFGVPAQLIGVGDAQTYNNMAEARLALYEETIIPLLRHLESDLNEWLVPLYGDDITLMYDIDGIPAITERRRMVTDNILRAVQEGVLTRNEARERLNLEPIKGGDEIYIPANLFPIGSAEPNPPQPTDEDDAEKLYEDTYGEKKSLELHVTREDAERRAEQIGCVGSHTMDINGVTYYMPCNTHATYEELTKQVNLKPTEEMAEEAQRGLDWRREFNRGGTSIGVARANQLVNRENLSESTVNRMKSFFSRHEVDKEAEGFRRGEDGYPSAGRIAWALWGGDAGFAWSKRKVDEINAENDKHIGGEELEDTKKLTGRIAKTIKNKVKEHNDEYGKDKGKRVTEGMLEAVFRRGVGAYRTNPQSVRPNVTSPDQWGIARVNVFLDAVRTGRFKRGAFDRDLLPKDHPLSTRE